MIWEFYGSHAVYGVFFVADEEVYFALLFSYNDDFCCNHFCEYDAVEMSLYRLDSCIQRLEESTGTDITIPIEHMKSIERTSIDIGRR